MKLHTSQSPLFLAGPAGPVIINVRYTNAFRVFLAGVQSVCGADPRIWWWPYRPQNDQRCVVFDIKGQRGEAVITVLETGDSVMFPVAPEQGERYWERVVEVTDMVDAHYLAARILEALGAASQSNGRLMLSPVLTTK